jgi:DNA/RNA-binding domain of Phe-tRNA-synthetase-like protein
MKFYVEEKIFDQLDNLCFGVVVAKGIDNTQKHPEIEKMLETSIAECELVYQGTKVKESPEIELYRDAFRTIGINPNKYMCSIEALLTRIAKKKRMPSINGIVNLGNAVSLKYRLPIGAHDLESAEGDFAVRSSVPEDYFIPFGSEEKEAVEENEIVYASGNSVRTRRWIWRQSQMGKITEETSAVMFPIDGFTENKTEVLKARDELEQKLKELFNCEVKTGWIDKDSQFFII